MTARDTDRRLGFLWAGTVVALVVLSPLAPYLTAGPWGCPLKALAGLPCPLCGTTRAAVDLAALDVGGALVRYPLPTLAWFTFLIGGLVAGWLAWTKRPFPRLLPIPNWAKAAILVAVLANWAYSIATGV